MKLHLLVSALHALMRIIMAAALLAMMILTFADVIGRYAFSAPIFGSSEMISFLLAMTLFAGLAAVTGERNHIAITLFESALRGKAGLIRRWFVHLFCSAALALLAVELFRHGRRMLHDRTATIVLEWELWPLVLAMAAMAAVGFALLLAPRPPRSGSGGESL
jgi:TRAP-type transport system small permease protein